MRRTQEITKKDTRKLFIEELERPATAQALLTTQAVGEESNGGVTTLAIGEECWKPK